MVPSRRCISHQPLKSGTDCVRQHSRQKVSIYLRQGLTIQYDGATVFLASLRQSRVTSLCVIRQQRWLGYSYHRQPHAVSTLRDDENEAFNDDNISLIAEQHQPSPDIVSGLNLRRMIRERKKSISILIWTGIDDTCCIRIIIFQLEREAE